MDIRPADLIFYRGWGIFDIIIKLVTWSPYSHVAGVVDDNMVIEVNLFRKTGYRRIDYYKNHVDVYTCDVITDKQRDLR